MKKDEIHAYTATYTRVMLESYLASKKYTDALAYATGVRNTIGLSYSTAEIREARVRQREH
jgi:hypothetical protein